MVFVDARRKKQLGEIELPSPRAPVFDRQGRLFVLVGNHVKRFRVASDRIGLVDEKTIIRNGLDAPRRLALDADGNLYVADWGKSQQIKVFDGEGRLQHTIGQPGGPKLGRYDEQRMNHPCGMAVDGRGQLWVAEAGGLPKRLSVWRTDGAFIEAFYGPDKYGGGGAFDPLDRTRFYYEEGGNGFEFGMDWEHGTSRLQAIYWCPELASGEEIMPGPAPERAFYVDKRQFLTNCYNGGLRYNNDRGAGIWRMDTDHVARPVAILGNGADLVNNIWGWRMKNRDAIVKLWAGRKPTDVLFVWSDRNSDGVAETEEIQWIAEDHSASPQAGLGGIGLEPLVHPDLSFTAAFGTRVPPPRIDEHGVPIYDLHKRIVVGDRAELRSPFVTGDRMVTHRDADGSWLGYDLKGERRWRYPAVPEEQIGGPGGMVAPTRLLGPAVKPTQGQAGPILAVNGEMGAVFLLTTDGLLLQTLGGDARLLSPIAETQPQRNGLMKNFTFRQEHFHPTINQTADGKIYLVAGFQESNILRLDGWDEIRRRDFGRLQVNATDLSAIPRISVQPSRKQGTPMATVAIRSRGPQVNGDLSDWPADTSWLRIDERASAAVAVDADNLYVAFRTGDAQGLDNTGRDPRYLFKSGGALDLMLGTDPKASRDRKEPVAGDLRLVVSRTNGRTQAELYRAVAPAAPPEDRVRFESPIGKVAFAQVRGVSDQVRLAQEEGNYEIAIPLKLLGLRPIANTEIRADVGILRGREGRTMQRVYWSNLDTVLVSDLPSEARLQPGRWGIWKFK